MEVTMKNLLLSLLVLMLPAVAAAQETRVHYKKGMVMDNGTWQKPTPETALRALMAQEVADSDPAAALLRQVFHPRPAAELDAFADELARIVREGTNVQSSQASLALIFSAVKYQGTGRGTPYAGAVDAFVRLYESFEDHAHPRASHALYGVFQTGGTGYVRDLFKASEKPPKPCFQPHRFIVLLPGEEPPPPPPKEEWCPNTSVWCQAGDILLYGGHDGPDPAAPDPEVWTPLCYRHR